MVKQMYFKQLLPLLIESFLHFKNCISAIVGGGIGGAATSHFLTEIFNNNLDIDLYEAKTIGGRLATVKIDNNEFEAGGSIIHPRNKYMQDFVQLLGTSFFILLNFYKYNFANI